MSHYTDHLAEYLSSDEHELHAQFAHLVAAFHVARAQSAKLRYARRESEALDQDQRAERFARVLENLMRSAP